MDVGHEVGDAAVRIHTTHIRGHHGREELAVRDPVVVDGSTIDGTRQLL